jgi:hypothetical protein
MITELVNKPFRAASDYTSTEYKIQECKLDAMDVEPYILCSKPKYGNDFFHAANIEKITATGIHWYFFFLGKQIKGFISFRDIKKGLLP